MLPGSGGPAALNGPSKEAVSSGSPSGHRCPPGGQSSHHPYSHRDANLAPPGSFASLRNKSRPVRHARSLPQTRPHAAPRPEAATRRPSRKERLYLEEEDYVPDQPEDQRRVAVRYFRRIDAHQLHLPGSRAGLSGWARAQAGRVRGRRGPVPLALRPPLRGPRTHACVTVFHRRVHADWARTPR